MTLLVIATLFAQTCSGTCPQGFDTPVLQVTGQGMSQSDVKMSHYEIILYADTYDEVEDEARNKADILKKEVIKKAKELGAKEKDVVLTNLNTLDPIEGDPYYRVEQDIKVDMKNVDDIDAVKESFLLIKGVSIGSVTPVVSKTVDYSQAISEARIQAVNNARSEAKALAEVLGVMIGEPLSVSEDIIYPQYTGYETSGESNITVYVTIVYEMIYKQ